MSIFDYFAPKTTDEQEKKTLIPTPHKKLFSELEETGGEVKKQCPEDGRAVDDFLRAVKEAYKARGKKGPEGGAQPLKGRAQFYLSKDRMSAYACLLPPENGGERLTPEEFLEDMHFEGITSGILHKEIPQEFEKGFLRVFPVARGKLPQAGEDGKVVELFRRRESMCLDVQNEGQVDFSQEMQLQPVRKGTVICLIRPPREGIEGVDVTGQKIPCPQGADAEVPQGVNTVIGKGGQALAAGVDGILYIENNRFCVHEQKIIDGDLDQFQGSLQISGNLYIDGNVDGGVCIEASGDIVINGRMGQARVMSESGTIRVQQGIYGTQGKTFLSAGRQVQAPVMEGAEIRAGVGVISEMVSSCAIRCDGTVSVTAGRGMITGSTVQAGESIVCLRVGNLAGERSHFSVGYPPNIPETWSRMKTELTEAQATIKKLWTTITDLRKKGSRISDMEKSVLDRLVEQRNLYVERKEALVAELGVLDKVLDKKSKGRVECGNVHPVLEVQIGRATEEVTTVEENCNIHVVDNRIVLR